MAPSRAHPHGPAAWELELEVAGLRRERRELRRDVGQLLAAQEHERQRLADALHDDLAQRLAAVLLELRLLPCNGPRGQQPIDDLHDQIAGVLGGLRDVAGALHPMTLTHLGLASALDSLAARAPAHDGRRLTVGVVEAPDPLPEPIATTAYRIVEEALDGCAPGEHATVDVSASTRNLRIGIQLPRHVEHGAALAAVRTRATLLRGTLEVDRAGRDRSCWHVLLPLDVPRTRLRPVASRGARRGTAHRA